MVGIVRPHERGSTLLDVVLASALIGLGVLASGAISLASRPGSLDAAGAGLPSFVARARALAQTTGDGATLAFVPSSAGFSATLYPHRPIPGSAFDAGTIEQSESFRVYFRTSTAGSGAFAIFFSSSGSASWTTWSPASGSLAAEPACLPPLELVLGASAAGVAGAPVAKPSPVPDALAWFTLSCEDATLRQS
jgi:hypothetical protein